MMLPITVPFHSDESATSAVARLARANGRGRTVDFCTDMGVRYQGLVDGDADVLDALAERGGFDRGALHANAVRKEGEGTVLNGCRVQRHLLARNAMKVCTRCIAEDMDDTALDPVLRPYGRTSWQVMAIRTCKQHNVALTTVDYETGKHERDDFVLRIEPHISGSPQLVEAAQQRSPSEFELYLETRLAGGSGGVFWLDDLPFYAVIRMAEVVGAVAIFGPRVQFSKLDDDGWWRAGAEGFAILKQGEAGVRGLLDDLRRTDANCGRDWALKTVFGRLYDWLNHETKDPAFEPLRDMVRQYAVENMPLGPGDVVLGGEVTTRRLHSVYSASRAYDLHPKRLRKMLYNRGFLGDADMQRKDHDAVFDAHAAGPFLEQLNETFWVRDAVTYLNATRLITRYLIEHGLLETLDEGNSASKGVYGKVTRDALDACLERLFQDATTDFAQDLVDIPIATARANCTAAEIVQLLFDRKLHRVGRDPNTRGFFAVRVDPEEIQQHVQLVDHGGLTRGQVQKRMHWNWAVVRGLLNEGLLPSRRTRNPVNRVPQTVVDPEDLNAFDRDHVTLCGLAAENGIHFKRLSRLLREHGVEPDPAFANVPATFYRRDEAEAVLNAVKDVSA